MADLVTLEPGAEGLGEMVADLIRANLETHPERRKHVTGHPARVNLAVTDAAVAVGLRFDGAGLRVGAKNEQADLTIECDAETLLGLSTVPLRGGMPDPMTPEGRAVARKLVRGELKVQGIPKHLPLMLRVQRLMTLR